MIRILNYLTGTILTAIAFSACIDENVAPDIVSSNLADTTIHIGSELAIEAEIQSDLVFNYQWFINKEKPNSDAIYVFTPEISGEYAVKLIVENKYGKDSLEALITVLP
jgi:hypothetical protein